MSPRAEQARKAVPECCFRCGAGLVSAALCFDCEAIQPLPPDTDHFRLFGLPRAYEIDQKALDAAYERLSFALHPDFQTGETQAGQARAQRLAAAVNEGYRVLRSEAERGAYLLDLLAGVVKLDRRQLPPGFLQQMFLLQEEIDSLGEDARPPEAMTQARRSLREALEARLRDALAERARLFREGGSAPTPAQLQAIQSNLNQETYLRRLLERLKE
jgi:molecular chaperone HscB